jgi:hypothetical protein
VAKRQTIADASAAQATGTPICIGFFFADHAVLGEDKSVTVVRTVDTITMPQLPTVEDATLMLLRPLKLVIILKGDNAKGKFSIAILCTGPDAEKAPVGVAEYVIGPDDRPESGVNVVTDACVLWRGPGLYWLELETNGIRLGRTPLRINVAEQEPASAKAEVAKPKAISTRHRIRGSRKPRSR